MNEDFYDLYYREPAGLDPWDDYWAEDGEDDSEGEEEDSLDDSWYDSDTLASAGWGTDEDYGYYGE